MKNVKAGDVRTEKVTIKKVKKGKATVVEINGERFVFDATGAR